MTNPHIQRLILFLFQAVNDYFGDNTNPPLIVYTLNQSLVHQYQIENNWEGIADLLIEGAKSLEKAGVQMLMFCACLKKLHIGSKVLQNCSRDAEVFCVQVCTLLLL